MTARRSLLAGIAALASLAMAGAAHAADRVVTAPLKKAFPYLDGYLSLPVGERDRFTVAYRLLIDGAASPALKLAVLSGAERTPWPMEADGRIGRLPTLAMLKSDRKIEIAGPEGHKVNLVLDIVPTVAPAPEIDAHALALAAIQATAGARKAAGVLGFAAPKLDRVVFEGAAGGQAVNTQGRATPLAVVKGNPVFDPALHADVRLIRFSKPPRRILLDKAG
jgi:hypothetical protein